MKINKEETKREIIEGKDGLTIVEKEERVVTISMEELVALKANWENKIAQININNSEEVLTNLREEKDLLLDIINCLRPIAEKAEKAKDVPSNIETIYKTLRDLFTAFQFRIDQIQKLLSQEYIDEQNRIKKELENGIKDIKPYADKAILNKKITEKVEERKGR